MRRAIGYLRQSFWPLREFADLHDVNRQARQWLAEVANRRVHRETRERPLERFQPEAPRPLPVIPYDYRDTVEALVHKDLRLQFDANKYCVPHRYVGQRLTIKVDSSAVTIYDRVHDVVSYPRCWKRGQTFGAERFERLLAEERPAARHSQAQQRLFDCLDGLCSRVLLEAYLRDMADTDRSLGRQISELLELIRQYGPEGVAGAIEKASAACLWRRLCSQHREPAAGAAPAATAVTAARPTSERTCDRSGVVTRLRRFIVESGKECDDCSRTETPTVEPVGDLPLGGTDPG